MRSLLLIFFANDTGLEQGGGEGLEKLDVICTVTQSYSAGMRDDPDQPYCLRAYKIPGCIL